MTLKHIKIFIAVCENKSVTKAAQKLYIAQPSVSLAIKELEEHYNVKLFDRFSRHLYLTEYGKEFYSKAKLIYNTFCGLEEDMYAKKAGKKFNIGTSITIGNCILPDILKKFKSQHTECDVNLTINRSDVIIGKILENTLDIALIEGIPTSEGIESKAFMNDELSFIISSKNPNSNKKAITAADAASFRFILREKGSGTREFFDSIMLINSLKLNIIGESISTHAIINLVKNDCGVSVLPKRLVLPYIKDGSIKTIPWKGINFNRQFYIIKHKEKELSEYAQEFINTVEQYC